MDKECGGRAEEQRVVVVRAEKSIERHETIAARPIFHHDRLAPACA
jgi:hypothetical protein